MSSNPTPTPAGSKALQFLQALQASNGYVALGISALGIIIPGVKAVISDIKAIGQGSVTITFTDLVAADDAELQKVIDASNADRDAINAELARLGVPLIPAAAPAPVLVAAAAKSHVTVNGKPI
jgi:hypothetical protein